MKFKCCPCCRKWSSIEERVAREYIRQQAESLTCGSLWSRCGCCYDRRCVKASYVIFLIFLIGALFMSNVGVMGFLPYSRTGAFEEGLCHLESVTDTSETFKCGRDKCPDNVVCDKYRCVKVKVMVVAQSGLNETTYLYATQEELYGRGESKHCALQIDRCSSGTNTDVILQKFLSDLGNSTFNCLHNPSDLSQVIRERTSPRLFSVVMVGVTALLLVLAIIGFIVTCLSCGCHCRVLCSPSPPRVIQKRLSVHRGQPTNSATNERF